MNCTKCWERKCGHCSSAGVVEICMPLGAIIVHEIRTADGRPIKIAQPRATGMAPLATGTAVRVAPVSRDAVTVFRTN